MKKEKIMFWSSTGILSLMMVMSAIQYLTNPQMKDAFVHLGFPDYFRVQLAIAKLGGAVLLLLPFVWDRLKQVAYFGFAVTFISAFVSHLAVGDPMQVAIMPLAFLGILSVSFYYHRKLVKGAYQRSAHSAF